MCAAHSADNERSVGSYLRTAREARGIALEEAARVTRIGQNYLTALEEDRFDNLPNSAYVKGFLRAYAAFLGLSGDEAVARYELTLTPAPHKVVKETDKTASGRPHETPGGRRRGRWIVPVVLLVLVAVAAYVFEENGREPQKPTAPLPAPAEAPSKEPILPTLSSARATVEPSQPPPEKDQAASLSPGQSKEDGLVLKLKVQQDCWLNIMIDDAVSQQYHLKPGDVIEWKGRRQFSLDIGNAGGVEGELNGKPLKPFGETGKPAHIVLKAGGLAP